MADAPTPPSGRDARKQAKADLAAAKARVKAEKPFWKKWWFILACIIVIAIAASSAGGGDADTGTTAGEASSDTSDDAGDSAETTGIGSPAADGKFTFTVNSFECGEDTIGKGFLKAEAKGEYCIAEVTVENTGDESQLMDGSSQYLYIDDKRYSADSDAIFADKRAEAFFIEEINPGLSVDGIIVWDVPAGSNPDRLELHDSPFSGGVEVNL